MRVIPTRIHGCLDYGLAIILVLSPWLFGFASNGPALWLAELLGFGLAAYSLATNYELGLLRMIPMPLHLMLDGISGVVLAGFALLVARPGNEVLPLAVIGCIEILSSLTTRTTAQQGAAQEGAGTDRRPAEGRPSQVHPSMPTADGPRSADGRPRLPEGAQGLHNVEQLRRAIDSGAMGDKIPMTDPATVPLGGDDEAAQLHDEEGLATARKQTRGKRQG